MALSFEKIKSEFLFSLPLILFTLTLLILPFFLKANLPNFKDIVKVSIITLLPYFDKFYFLSLSIIFFFLLFKFTKEIKALILGFSMLFILNYVGWIYSHVRAIPIKEAAIYVKKHNIKKIVMYHLNTPSFDVYAKMLVEKRYPKVGDIVLTKVDQLKKFNYELLFKKGVIALIKIKPQYKSTQPFNYKKDKRK